MGNHGAPLYFVRSGVVGPPLGSLRRAGNAGYSWSAAAYSKSNAYYLHLNAANAFPSYNNYPYAGFPIRCVAL